MKIKEIKNQEDYNNAIIYLEELDAKPDFEDREDLIKEFDRLADLIEKYEEIHFPVETIDDPVELIKIAMSYRDLKQKDLYHIASKSIISEIMNKKRAMSKSIIREFSKFFLIDQEALNVKYELNKAAKKVKTKHNSTIKNYFHFNPNLLSEINNYQRNVTNSGMLLKVCANY